MADKQQLQQQQFDTNNTIFLFYQIEFFMHFLWNQTNKISESKGKTKTNKKMQDNIERNETEWMNITRLQIVGGNL